MNVKITTVVENTLETSVFPLIGEHGLAFFIESQDRKILFDTGQGQALVHNANLLGINLQQVDTVVLSHGHFDHAGGLKKLTAINSDFQLIAHQRCFEPKYFGIDGTYHSIGATQEGQDLETRDVRRVFSDQPQEISPGIWTTGEIPLVTDFEVVEPVFFTGETGAEVPDTLPDDQAMFLTTDQGIVVVLGCAHRGVINTLNQVLNITGTDKIHAVLGGMHLLSADDKKMENIVKQLRKFGVEKLIVGHCTGFCAMTALRNAFGAALIPNTVGHVMEF